MKNGRTTVAEIDNRETAHLLGPDTVDLLRWPSLDHRNYRRDVGFVAVSTAARALQHGYFASAFQDMESFSVAVFAGASTTPNDLSSLEATSALRPDRLKVSKGWLFSRYVYHPNSPQLFIRRLGRGLVNGMESEPMHAVQLMQSNPLFINDVRDFADGVARHYLEHRMVGVKNICLGGFGGTEPVERFVTERIARQIVENWRINVKFLPTTEEPLGQANARGMLYKLVVDGLGENRLYIFKQNTRRGSHGDDDALIHGLITITSTDATGRESDASSILRTLRRTGSGYVEAKPAVVALPLTRIGRRRLTSARDWLVRPSEYEGSHLLETMTIKARMVLAEEPEAFHVLTACGQFTDAEAMEFKQAVMTLLKPGHVVAMINRLCPRIEGESGRWTMCDFVTSPQLPRVLTDVFSGEREAFCGSGLSPADFIQTVPPPPELEVAQRVTEAVQRLNYIA
jgi:hypothetical protein